MLYIVCLISGILTALPMLFDTLWPLSWVAMAPLFYIMMKEKPKYRYALLFSLGYYGPLYYWFTCLYPMDFAGFTAAQGLLVVIVCWIGLALLQSLGTALIAWLFRAVKGNKRWLYPLELAAAWTLLEWMQTQTWAGVPFFRIALSQCSCLQMIQCASLLGSLFIGFLIAFVNGCFALGFLHECEKLDGEKDTHKFKFRPNIAAAVGASVVAVNFICGFLSLIYYKEEAETVPVAVIQGNISSGEKWKENSVYDTCDLYCSLTREAVQLNDAVIVVWPETVINVNMASSLILQEQISALAKECGAYIIVGTFDKVLNEESGDIDTYNAQLLFCPDGSVSQDKYYKRKLVPFGEFLPMADVIKAVLPVLADMNILSSDLTAGSDATVFTTDYGRIGGLICYDSIYETLARASVNNGAQLIALSTNDSWYKDSAAVYQHNKHSVLRAVENGRYVIRSANTGVSSIISPTGEILESLDALKEGYVIGNVCFESNTTPYARVGNVIVGLSGIIWAVCMVVKLGERRPTAQPVKKRAKTAGK